jgi:hemolysin D
VIDVSRDANKDDKFGLIYPVRVRLDAADILVDGKRVAIAPGWLQARRSSPEIGG